MNIVIDNLKNLLTVKLLMGFSPYFLLLWKTILGGICYEKNIYRAISCKYPLVSNSNAAKKPNSLSAMICFGSGTPMYGAKEKHICRKSTPNGIVGVDR